MMALIEKKKPSRLEALSCYVSLSQLKETEINLFKQVKAILLAPVVQTMDSAIHRINRYPLDK